VRDLVLPLPRSNSVALRTLAGLHADGTGITMLSKDTTPEYRSPLLRIAQKKLPISSQNTGWALEYDGNASTISVDYEQAENGFLNISAGWQGHAGAGLEQTGGSRMEIVTYRFPASGPPNKTLSEK